MCKQKCPVSRASIVRVRAWRLSRRIAVALTTAAALVVLAAGCSDSNSTNLPPSTASRLSGDLDRVAGQTEAGSCEAAQHQSLPQLRAEIASLPSQVDPGVRQTLTASTAQLSRLVADECRLVRVPDIKGKPLDEAQTQLKQDDLRVKTVGGGLFGIVVAHNWTVCEAKPASGTRVFRQSEVELTVARSC